MARSSEETETSVSASLCLPTSRAKAVAWRVRRSSACVRCRFSMRPTMKRLPARTPTSRPRPTPTARRARRLLRERNGIVGHLVADTPDRHDGALVADLAAQLTDVDVDRPGVAREGVAPDALEQLLARQHHPAVIEQLPEEVELLGRELHGAAVDGALAAIGVDRDRPVGLAALGLGWRRRGAA